MPFVLPLPAKCPEWTAKIHDREQLEAPHITIYSPDGRKWRWSLREPGFLDTDPDPRHVHRDVVATLELNLGLMCDEWDARFPENPVHAKED